MRIGIFSLIGWSFLDQRPQVLAKKVAEWGHSAVYIEPFDKFDFWDDKSPHPFSKYETMCWKERVIKEGLSVATVMSIPPHKRFLDIQEKNNEYKKQNIAFIKKLNLDLAIVVDPQYAEWCELANIPFIYDHVDDTHHMHHVIKDVFWNAQIYAEQKSLTNVYIQPRVAQRNDGLYVPNGFSPADFKLVDNPIKKFDSGVLSCIADWFDMESIMQSKKNLLLIGPMEPSEQDYYQTRRHSQDVRVNWLPRMSRRMGGLWLQQCATGMVPFRQDHKVIDYVMPLKIVEYFYLGLPAVCYVNKCIFDEFGDEAVSFYSPTGWLGYPSLDKAIERAQNCDWPRSRIQRLAANFEWDKVLLPLKNYIASLTGSQASLSNTYKAQSSDYLSTYKVALISSGEALS